MTWFLIIFLLIPVASIALCFVSDAVKGRKIVLNILLLVNVLLYFSPLIYAFLASFPDGNMWSENGPGAALWLYFYIGPLCFVLLLILLVLKLVFRKRDV